MFIHYIFNYNQKAGNEKSQNLFIRHFLPILSPLPLPQHLDVQPPTYYKIPPAFRPPSTRRQNTPLRYRGTSP